jgi:hypothetical protein
MIQWYVSIEVNVKYDCNLKKINVVTESLSIQLTVRILWHHLYKII